MTYHAHIEVDKSAIFDEWSGWDGLVSVAEFTDIEAASAIGLIIGMALNQYFETEKITVTVVDEDCNMVRQWDKGQS